MPSEAEENFLMRVWLVISITVVAYDIVLTSRRELECIWRRKRGVVITLFISQRYCMLLLVILRLVNTTNLTTCAAISYLKIVLTLLCSFGVAAFSILRTWAICGRFNILVFLVVLCSAFEPLANIYNYARSKVFSIDNYGCEMNIHDYSPADKYMPAVTRSASILTDLLVLMITWIKSADVWRASRELKQFRPKVSTLLVQDGTLYFGALFILNVITLWLDVSSMVNPAQINFFSFVTSAMPPLLIARFIFDLRDACSPDRTTHSHDLTTFHCVPGSPNGGPAAPRPTSTWFGGEIDDLDNGTSTPLVSFSVGLMFDGSNPTAESQLERISATEVQHQC